MSIPSGRRKPSLISAAQAHRPQSNPPAPTPRQTTATLGPSSPSAPIQATPLVQTDSSRAISDQSRHSSTPTLPDSSRSTPARSQETAVPVAKLKFKPKVPIRRVKQEVDVKPDVNGSSTGVTRVAPRGRGRGRGRGAPAPSDSLAAGPFGGPRAQLSTSTSFRRGGPTPVPRGFETSTEVYSDHSDTEAGGIIDIDAVSGLGESAPTSLFRDRKVLEGRGNAKQKVVEDQKGKAKDRMDVDDAGLRVKPEPLSPVKPTAGLPDPNEGVLPPREREDDIMISGDEDEDRDARGRRVRTSARVVGLNEMQKVDLSESESEEEEESMEGDFISTPGYDEPQDKLFIFQFPNLFPQFIPSGPVDISTDDVKPDIKPTAPQLKAKRKHEAPPEGRIGTMLVMKSGKVKMVLGSEIVMNVTPGVPATFLQQLVHLDPPNKGAIVLGEVHKQYIVTPDIDRLLRELYLNGGATPGDKEAEARSVAAAVKVEQGLVKMEVD